MIILVEKNTHEIWHIGDTLTFLSNGYPCVDGLVSGSPDDVDAFDVEPPESPIEPISWCYTEEDGFYENPKRIQPYENPYGVPDDIFNTIIDEYTIALIEEGVIE